MGTEPSATDPCHPEGSRSQSLPVSQGCFVCGKDNPHGLRLRFQHEDGVVSTSTTLPDHTAGFDQRTHGGIVAGLLDEAMGWATVLASRRFTYTAELLVRYRDRVPVGEPLTVIGRVDRNARRLLLASASILDVDGTELATATGKFLTVSAEETETIAGALIYSPSCWRLQDGDDS